MPVPYEELIKENKDAFIAKVNDVAARLSIPAEWLFVRMKNESGLRADIRNSIGCVGLIQFCPDTPRGSVKTIGGVQYSLDDIAGMSNVDQMDVVYAYYKQYKSKLLSYHDLLLSTLFPRSMAKPDTTVLEAPPTLSADTIARQNPKFDIGKKGYVTVGDVRTVSLLEFPQQLLAIAEQSADTATKYVERNWVAIAAVTTLLAVTITTIVLYKKKIIKIGNTVRP